MVNKFTILICTFAIFVALTFEAPSYEDEFVVKNMEGYVVSEQSFSEKTSSFVFEDYLENKILIKTDKYFDYNYGDKVSISGELKIPNSFDSGNGITFDYKNFLIKDGITHTAFFPDLKLIEKNSKRDLFWLIFNFKDKLVIQTRKIFDPDTSPLVLGILLGLKDSIDKDLENNFRKTGLIHILVLSGFNLTIIAYFVFKALKNTHRNFRYSLSLLLIFLFVIMVGAGATVVRSSIMISLFILSKFFRRNSNPNNALIFAASIMVLHNPMILLHDPSFQLSFVATFGLVNFYPLIEKIISKMNFFGLHKDISVLKSLKEIVVSNIAVQIAVIPLLAFLMGEFSVIAIIPNILVLPIIPIFMLTSFLAIVTSFINVGFHLIFVMCVEFLSKFIISTVNYFGDFGFATVKMTLDIRYLLMFYLFLTLTIAYLQARERFISKRRYSYLQ